MYGHPEKWERKLKDHLTSFIILSLLNELSKRQDTWHSTWNSKGRSELSLRVEINLNTGGILYLDCVYSNAVYSGRKLKGIDGGIRGKKVNREEVIVRNILSALFQCPSLFWVPKTFDTFGEVSVSISLVLYNTPILVRLKKFIGPCLLVDWFTLANWYALVPKPLFSSDFL